jgi:hypothetical protein
MLHSALGPESARNSFVGQAGLVDLTASSLLCSTPKPSFRLSSTLAGVLHVGNVVMMRFIIIIGYFPKVLESAPVCV